MDNTNHIRDSIILWLLANLLVFLSSTLLAYGNAAPMPLNVTFVAFAIQGFVGAAVLIVAAVISLSAGITARGKKDV